MIGRRSRLLSLDLIAAIATTPGRDGVAVVCAWVCLASRRALPQQFDVVTRTSDMCAESTFLVAAPALRYDSASMRLSIFSKLFLSHFAAIVLVSGSVGYFYFSAIENLMQALRSRLQNSAALISQDSMSGIWTRFGVSGYGHAGVQAVHRKPARIRQRQPGYRFHLCDAQGR